MSATSWQSSQNQIKKKVLIVDDLPQVRLGLRQLLELTGLFEIAEAVDPQEAVRQTQLFCPHAVLVDLQMPNQNGYQTCQLIKAIQPSPRVVVLSADASQEEIERAVASGADRFVMKGERYEVLVNALLGIDNSPISLSEKEGE